MESVRKYLPDIIRRTLFLVAALLLLVPTSAPAQGECTDPQVAREQVLQFINFNRQLLIASNASYQVTSATEIKTSGGETLTLAQLTPGAVLKLDYCPANAPTTAGEIPLNFKGILGRIERTAIVGVTPTFLPTRTPGPTLTPVPTRTLEPTRTPGPSPTIIPTRTLAPSPTPIATRTPLADRILEGQIQGINAPDKILKVQDVAFRVVAETVLIDRNGAPITFEALQVGNRVRAVVGAAANSATTLLVAREVKLLDNSDPDKVTLEGAIDAIDTTNSVITVLQQQIMVTPQTEIRGTNGAELGFGDLAVGDRVAVEAQVIYTISAAGFAPGPSLIALKIRKLNPAPVLDMKLEGAIAELNATNKSLVVVNSATRAIILTNSETVIRNSDGAIADFSYLRVAQRVAIVGVWLPTASPVATATAKEIRVLLVDPTPSPEVELLARVDAIQSLSKTFTAAGRVIVTNDATVFAFADSDTTATFASLKVNDLVRIKGVVATAAANSTAAAAILARQVTIVQRVPEPIAVEFAGRIDDILWGSGQIIVDGRYVAVTATTEIRNASGARVGFEALRKGLLVKVKGVSASSNDSPLELVVAREIRIVETQPPVEVVANGAITSLVAADVEGIYLIAIAVDANTTNSRTVSAKVNGDTRITDADGVAIPVRALKVGDVVRMVAQDPDGTGAEGLIALVIQLRRAVEPLPIVGLEGVVESINDELGTLVVKGALIRTNAETAIVGIDGATITLTDIAAGDFVKVKGARQSDGSVLAQAIAKLDDPVGGDDREVEFRGPISEVDNDTSSVIVAGRFVIVSSTTEILNADRQPTNFAALQIGEVVEVKGRTVAFDGLTGPPAVAATRIKIEGPGCVERKLVGAIEAIDGSAWTVDGKAVAISDSTKFAGRDGKPLTAADFAVATRVAVTGCAAPGASLTARLVVKLGNAEVPPACRIIGAFDGSVSAVDTAASTVTVNRKTIAVGPSTELFKAEVGTIALKDIVVGDKAFVQLSDQSTSGSVVACRILIRAAVVAPPQENRVLGRISSITTATMTLQVRDVTVKVTDETKIVARRGVELRFADLVVGQLVDAHGRLDADGVLVAGSIRVQEENVNPGTPAVVVGPVKAIALPNNLTVGEQVVTLTDKTKYRFQDGSKLVPEDLSLGDEVSARIDRDAIVPAVMPPVLIVKELVLRASILQNVDTTSNTITYSGRVALVTPTTTIRDARSTATLALADLRVGDLVHVRIRRAFPPQAASIVRFNPVTFSAPVEGYDATGSDSEDGHPVVIAPNPTNSLGWIRLPLAMSEAAANSLYDVRMKVATNVTNRAQVPTIRVRLNMQNFEKGTTYEIDSRGRSSFVPTPEGREFRALFVPPADTANLADADRQFFASLDVLAFDNRIARNARLRLEDVSVNPISLDRVTVLRTLVRNEFTAGTEGWEFGSAPASFTPPQFGQDSGALSLAPVDAHSFGFWTLRTGINAEAGKLYRARFVMSSTTDNAAQVPPFRLRLNTSNFELASTALVDAQGTLLETATTTSKVYDVYMIVPADATNLDTLLASFDLLAFGQKLNVDTVINLEQFLLEEVEIAP